MTLYTYSTLELLGDSTCTFGLDIFGEVLPTLLILACVTAVLIFPLVSFSLPNKLIGGLLGISTALAGAQAAVDLRDRRMYGSPHPNAPNNRPKPEEKPESSGSDKEGSTSNTPNSGQGSSPESKGAALFPLLPVYMTLPSAELTDIQMSGCVMFYCSITCLVCAYITFSLLFSVVVYQQGVKAFNLENHPLIAKFFLVSYPVGVFLALLATCLLASTAFTLYQSSLILA
jgi:hypothetical protein